MEVLICAQFMAWRVLIQGTLLADADNWMHMRALASHWELRVGAILLHNLLA